MRDITRNDDAFGQALMDYFHNKETHYIVERDDGFADPGLLEMYFTEYPAWPAIEQQMPKFVRGRVLDVGCGAGRHTLHIQSFGLEVVGIDKSPLAIEVAKQRGLRQAYAISLDELARNSIPYLTLTRPFGSIIMMGHNIGLLHGLNEGRKILRAFHRITTPDARIIGTTRDPHDTDDPNHLAYQKWNREQGRMPGQLRLRIRHRKLVSEWFYYLFLSEEELRHLAQGTGWRVETVVNGDGGFGGAGSYLAVLCKE